MELEFIDHVAIRVKNLHESASWYEKVLGLVKVQKKEWGDFPIFMMTGKFGIALFPAKMDDPNLMLPSRNVKIDHFAFNVTKENFEKAQSRFKDLNVDFQVQDHHYFHSIYIKDPDGHTVELTTLMMDSSDFYNFQ